MKFSFKYIFILLFFMGCKKHEENNYLTKKIEYKGSIGHANLSNEMKRKAFKKWKFTNVIFYDKNKTIKIPVNKEVYISEENILDTKNQLVAKKHRSIGTYEFTSLDSLNVVCYIFTIASEKNSEIMTMKSTTRLFRVVNRKSTNQYARVEMHFVR